MLLKDNELPMLQKSNNDRELPKRAQEKTETMEPRRANCLMDNEDAILTSSRSDKEEPKRVKPKIDSDEPSRPKVRKESELPMC